MLRSWTLAFLILTLAAGSLQARIAPDPLPPWDRLVPATTNERLFRIEDITQQFWTLNDRRVYVWDIAVSSDAEGRAFITRAEFQHEDGTFESTHSPEWANGPDMRRAYWLDAMTDGTNERLWWSDASGEVHVMNLANTSPGDLRGGGRVVADPTKRCTQHFTGQCNATTCTTTCTIETLCGCTGGKGVCVLQINTLSCRGDCEGSQRCSAAAGGGCSCG